MDEYTKNKYFDLMDEYTKNKYFDQWINKQKYDTPGYPPYNATQKINIDLVKMKDSIIDALMKKYDQPIPETDEEKVIRIFKRDFEKSHGMTFERFVEVYKKLIAESPEKLI